MPPAPAVSRRCPGGLGTINVHSYASASCNGRLPLPLRSAGEGRMAQAWIAPSYFLCGGYQLASPSSSFLAAASGVIVPLITCALTFQISFSRLGVPRERIW